MPKRKRARKRRCIHCGHELPGHFVTCKLATAIDFSSNFKHVEALAKRVKKPALSLIVDNTKDKTDAQD